jgi:hypothetical protein
MKFMDARTMVKEIKVKHLIAKVRKRLLQPV